MPIGVVHQRIEPAKAADRVRDEFRQPVEFGEIGLLHEGAARTHGFQLGGERIGVRARLADMQ